jgi:hypothetical protein
MKSVILAAVIAAGIGGFACSSDAQDVKKLPPHPAAAADKSLQQGSVALPSATATHGGGESAHYAKPTTGEVAPSGETSTRPSKQ